MPNLNDDKLVIVTHRNALLLKKNNDEIQIIDVKHATRKMITKIADNAKINGVITNKHLSVTNRDYIHQLISTDEYTTNSLTAADKYQYELQFKNMTENKAKNIEIKIPMSNEDIKTLRILIRKYNGKSVIKEAKLIITDLVAKKLNNE